MKVKRPRFGTLLRPPFLSFYLFCGAADIQGAPWPERGNEAALEADSASLKGVIQAMHRLAASFPDSALGVLDAQWSALSRDERKHAGLGYFLARADVRLNAANVPACVQECDSAMRYRREGHSEDEAAINIWRGRAFALIGDYAIANRLIESSLAVYLSQANLVQVAECHNELGWFHYVQEQYALAERRWRAMLAIAREVRDLRLEAIALRRVGLACLYLYDPDDIGLAYYDTALTASRVLGDARELASIHSNIGLHMDSAIMYARASGDQARLFSIMHTAGVGGMKEKNDPLIGLDYCGQAHAFAKRVGNRMLQRDAAACLCDAYRILGDWKEAFRASEEWRGINDQIVSTRSRDEIAMRAYGKEFEARAREDSIVHAAELERSESARTIESLRADRNQNRSYALGLGAMALMGGGWFYFRLDRKRRRERHERDAARLQTQILRTQMNPHFIFNALNSINDYVQSSEKELASGFLTKFARLMRLVLENSRHDEVPLSQDLEALRLYMDLERARMNDRFRYEVDIDPAIDQEETLVPPLVLQPFVENAIWHGLSRKEGIGLLRLSVRQANNTLVMTVEDDGVGRGFAQDADDPLAPPKTSMGSGITQERLVMLGKQRGGTAGFQYVEIPSGTRVEVSMPCN